MRRINYPTPLTWTLLKQAQQWNIDEHLQRTRFADGVLAGIPGYGIVDGEDPATVVSGSSRPFTVSATTGSYLLAIQGGTIVFGNGEMITLPPLASLGMPTTYLGQRHVLYIVFAEAGHDPRMSDFDVYVDSWTGAPDDAVAYVRIARKIDYDALGSETKASVTIPLAILTPTNTGVVIDQSRAEAAYLRPWATAVDVQHRSLIGSGTPTNNNPHGQTISDLAVSANLGFYDFLLPHGIIVAKDLAVAGVPGHLCTDTITALGVGQDLTGQITGYAGAYYFTTSKFPTQVLSVVGVTSGKQIAAAQIPQQNVIMFLPDDEWDTVESLTVQYTAVTACMPPTGSSLVTFPAMNPDEAETIVAGGDIVQSVFGDLSLATCGPYPFNMDVYMNVDGSLQRVPATLKCDVPVGDLVSLQPFDIQPLIPCKLRLGLRSAVANVALDVQFEITGTRDDDTLVTETVAFGGTWTDSVIPATSENASQWVTTTNTFVSLESITTIVRLNDGPNSAVTVQALYDTDDLELASNLPVAEVFWDGLRMAEVKDARPVQISATSVQTVDLAAATAAFAESTLLRSTAPTKAILGAWFENFDAPLWVGPDSSVVRWSPGLGVGDTYISRPIPVRPHLDDAVSFRLHPVEPDKGFTGSVRFFTDVDGWSGWLNIATFTSPKYTYSFAAGRRLVKWQARVTGPAKGLIAVYLAAGDTLPPSLIFDSGVFGIDSLG